MTKEQGFEVLSTFYDNCLAFWKRELMERGFDDIYIDYKSKQNAWLDTINITHWPFSPKAEEIPHKWMTEWITENHKKVFNN